MLVTVLGAAAGGLMLRPTPEQVETLHAGYSTGAVGAHTVGGHDGGPGLAGVGWSTQHGDLRVAHFFGLHGVQIIPFIGWLAFRRGNARQGRKPIGLAFAIASSYLAFVAMLTWQALRGQSIITLDGAILSALVIWIVATAAAVTSLHGSVSQHSSPLSRLTT